MTESRNASVKRRSDTIADKAIRAVVDTATRVLEALGPQPRLQPIPVRVRRGNAHR